MRRFFAILFAPICIGSLGLTPTISNAAAINDLTVIISDVPCDGQSTANGSFIVFAQNTNTSQAIVATLSYDTVPSSQTFQLFDSNLGPYSETFPKTITRGVPPGAKLRIGCSKTIRGSAGLPRQWVLVPLQVTVSGAQYSTANPPLGDPFSAVAFFPIDGVSQCNPEGRWVLLNIHPFATLQTVLTARYGSANGPVGEMVPPDIPPDTVDALTCRSKYTIGPVIQKTIKANLVDLGWPAFRFTVAK